MLVSLTVGKVDAGVAVLLTEDKRLIEFPSILLPSDIHSGSIVDINVSRNQHAELIAEQKFISLQSEIFDTFGSRSPSPPVLRCRNATQTSVVLEWDPIERATAEMRSLSLYRNSNKAGVIPKDKLSTKISGLALDTEYNFQLVLRTSAGQYASEKITVRTHKMTDLTGITITPGIMAPQLKDSLAEAVSRIGAKMIDTVRIDTTHFVCTEPRGQAWEKAVEMNVPVVVPDWVLGCEREKRIVGVRSYYLDADPKLRQIGPTPSQQRGSVSTVVVNESPRIEHTPPTPEQSRAPGNNTSNTSIEPPTPPPKSTSEAAALEKARETESSPEPEPVEKPTKAVQKANDDDDDEEEEDSDDTEIINEKSKSQAGAKANKKDEDNSFDEVAL